MSKSESIILSTSYLGPIEYFAQLLMANKIIIDPNEHYQKQTYRNRCVVATANGKQPLIIPVKKPNGNHTKVKDVLIDYAEPWQKLHWGAIMSAYSHSPFLLYYQDALEPFYQKQYKFLFDYNQQLLDLVLDFLKRKLEIEIPENYIEKVTPGMLDFRNAFSPKKSSVQEFPPYIQVFSEKHGFYPNLSILDLLLNEGPAAKEYLFNFI